MRYPIPAARTRVEEIISRSHFISTAEFTSTVEEARAFIAEIKAEFADATHNCYAFVVGPPGSTAQIGMSDDGEPSGTAGRPMLAVLLGSGVGDVTVVVTRFFGGTKLGTGGLVRAYSGSVKNVLAELPTVEKVARVRVMASSPYSLITPVLRLLPEFEAEIVEQSYTADVMWLLDVPEERVDGLLAALNDLSSGVIDAAVV